MGDERAGDRKEELLELDDPSGESSGARPVSQPTIRPPFDPVRFAEEAVREPLPTITDETATEQARITSVLMDSSPPRSRAVSGPELKVDINDMEALSPDEQ